MSTSTSTTSAATLTVAEAVNLALNMQRRATGADRDGNVEQAAHWRARRDHFVMRARAAKGAQQ